MDRDYDDKERPKRHYINGLAIAANVPSGFSGERVFNPMPKRTLTEEDKRMIEEDDKVIREIFENALRKAARRYAEEERIRNERIENELKIARKKYK